MDPKNVCFTVRLMDTVTVLGSEYLHDIRGSHIFHYLDYRQDIRNTIKMAFLCGRSRIEISTSEYSTRVSTICIQNLHNVQCFINFKRIFSYLERELCCWICERLLNH